MTHQSYLSLLVFVCCLSVVHAQQLPLFAHYPNYQGLINPASVPMDFLKANGRKWSFDASNRVQSDDLGPFSPKTFVLNGSYIRKSTKSISAVFGGYFQQDEVGITKNTEAYLRGGVMLKLGPDLRDGGLSIGFNAGINRRHIDKNDLFSVNLDDPNLPDSDSTRGDLGVGVFYYQKLRKSDFGPYVYAGYSFPRLLDGKSYANYGLLGFYLPSSNGRYWELSAWSRQIKNLAFQYSINLRRQFHKQFWAGVGSITPLEKPVFTGELGYNHFITNKLWKISYAFTYAPTDTRDVFGNTHEIHVSLAIY